MKTRIYTTIITLFFLFGTISLTASDFSAVKSKTAVSNLITAINSNNDGLRRSAIYFAGKYSMAETKEALLTQFKKETDPETRILIVHSLYRINDGLAMEKVHELVLKDSSAKVRRLGNAIYETYKLENYANQEFVADIN